MGTLNLGTGSIFVGGADGLSDAPAGTIIQTAINGSTSDITVNSDGSYTDIISINFTPRQSNSKLIYTLCLIVIRIMVVVVQVMVPVIKC